MSAQRERRRHTCTPMAAAARAAPASRAVFFFWPEASGGRWPLCTPLAPAGGAYRLPVVSAVQVLRSLERGEGSEADLDKLLDICDNILGRAFCPFGDGAVSPVISSIKYFRDEFIEHNKHGGCPFDPAASTLFSMEPV